MVRRQRSYNYANYVRPVVLGMMIIVTILLVIIRLVIVMKKLEFYLKECIMYER